MVLPTVEKMLRSMPIEEMCSYAPIGGIPGFNEAVQISLFGHVSERFHVDSVPTPGGCGAPVSYTHLDVYKRQDGAREPGCLSE